MANPHIEIREYLTANGKNPYRDWLLKIRDRLAAGIIQGRVGRLEFGHLGDCKSGENRMKTKRSVAHEEGLLEDLRDMNFVIGYLNSILDGLNADESLEPFLLALGRVAKAHGIQKLAVNSKRTRDAVYKALSKKGNPTFSTLHGILNTMGLQLQVQKKRRA